MRDFLCCLKAAFKFRGYLPQAVTLCGALRWIRQFDQEDRKHIGQLLDKVIYLSEATVKQILVSQNAALLTRLAAAGLPPEKIIYVQVHDAGSSSPVMLNMLRDAVGLEQRKCKFLDANNTLGLNRITNELGEGALIYIDDFVGSGNQFCNARDFAIQHVVGNFSEFLLVPSICEEGLYLLGQRGIEAFSGHVHSKAERPLHENSMLLGSLAKQRLSEICLNIDPKMGLGFKRLATMVVLYRNAPNNVPVILRGSETQQPYVGILPRTTDLPITQ